ncbi:MAG: Glutathione import ATP-binding protein GsiA [Pseudomonadota bacterium]|jgi:peptide/nickel transport system ATP-binding protein
MIRDIQVQDLSVELITEAGIARAVDALSLSIDRGETFALVGESGCGKSMTAMALMRLLPDNGAVVNGSVQLRDLELLSLSEAQMQSVRGRRLSVVFQEPATSLNPVMTVGKQIIEVIERHTDVKGAAAREKALEWLERVGLPEPRRRIDAYPFELSGGQIQRVMIALALAAEPDLLIADEPTTALDVTIQAQILDLMKSLQRERGMAILLITHDLAVVSDMAHQVALMYAGQIVELANVKDFFTNPGHPYAQLLLQALPGEDRRDQSLAAIEGTVPELTHRFLGCRFASRCPWVQDACTQKDLSLIALGHGSAPPDTTADRHVVRCARAGQIDFSADVATRSAMPANGLQNGTGVVSLSQASDDTQKSVGELLSVKDLTVRYRLGGGFFERQRYFDAVRGISFNLPQGQTLALVGESGCGKTTTGKAIMNILGPRALVGGQIVLNGTDLVTANKQALHRARQTAQIIFQNPFSSLNPRQRIREVLEEGMRSLHPEWTSDERAGKLTRLMESVGLNPKALDRYPHEFSGGQRQRIAIARALAVEPKLIVCDEPTSALDVSVQAQILNLLRSLQRELSVSYLFITHNIGVVSYLGDRVAVMHEGQIVESGSVDQVLGNPQVPYTRTLLSAVPKLKQF